MRDAPSFEERDKAMKKHLASLAVLAIAVAAGSAAAQTTPPRGQFAFEVPGESVRPAELAQQKPNSVLGQAYHGYGYSSCYNYYRWYYDRWYGWQRYYIGTRCY
jgi:opacity protein-like surface antigen